MELFIVKGLSILKLISLALKEEGDIEDDLDRIYDLDNHKWIDTLKVMTTEDTTFNIRQDMNTGHFEFTSTKWNSNDENVVTSKSLCYVVEKNSDWKTINVYEMINNKPKFFFQIECPLDCDSENEIQVFLDDNGYGDNSYSFYQM